MENRGGAEGGLPEDFTEPGATGFSSSHPEAPPSLSLVARAGNLRPGGGPIVLLSVLCISVFVCWCLSCA